MTTLTASGCFMGNQTTLTSITVDANNTKYDSRNNCNAIIEKGSNSLILGCKNTTIPDGISSIGKYAFERCNGLISITIPASVTSLQEGAFFSAGLTSISLPSALKRIEFNALAYNNIASITIPASVEYIEQSTLRACSNLTQITVEADNTIYDSRNNCNAIIETATNTLIQGCNTATIPTSVTAIGNQAFQECYGLASITIPASVSSIADLAFSYCYNLTSVSVEAKTPFVIAGNTFTNIPESAVLYVPATSIEAYKSTSPWNNFKNIEPINTLGKCATPEISYANGKLTFTCETDGAECVATITDPDITTHYGNEITLSLKYTVSVYATKNGYDNSDVATREIIIEKDQTTLFGDLDKDGKVNVADHVKLSDIIMNK